jgi:hypothetical protein
MHPFRPLLMPAVAAALIQALVTCSGCASLGKPDWLDPGPVRSQQRKAVRFDPYLEGGPLTSSPGVALLDGLRPRDFSAPVPEIRRSRWWAPAQ